MSDVKGKCQICGEHMPRGEEMFNYHGLSGPCPKPPLQQSTAMVSSHEACQARIAELEAKIKDVDLWLERIQSKCGIPDAREACRQILKYANECREILEGKDG